MYSGITMLEWQDYCSSQILDNNKNNLPLEKRFFIYKVSINAIHHNALRISFPILRKLLGDRIFGNLVGDYIKAKDWNAYSLDEFGDDLSSFVRQHNQLSPMPYMAELVEIEWQVQLLPENHKIEFNLDQQLQSLLTNHQDIGIQIKPNVSFISSEYGGIEIWLAHQNNLIEEIDLQQIERSYWYLMRNSDEILVDSISLDLYQLTTLIQANTTLLELCEVKGVELAVRDLKILLENELISFRAI